MDLRGLLLDLDGVLYVEDEVIPGAPETVSRLRDTGYAIRFLTNTTMKPRDGLVDKLLGMGIHAERNEVFSTAVVAARWLAREGVTRVQLLVHEDTYRDFDGFEITRERPDAVVVGDLGQDFTFDILNGAFLSIRDGARFVALQKNRYWMTRNGPALDAGAFVAALEYASATTAVLVGKPNRAYFETALEDMGLPASQVLMVGDDVHTDIVGAQAVGARTLLVKTGKYALDADAPSPTQADGIIASIAELPRWLERRRS